METWTWRHGHGVLDMDTWTWRHGHGVLDMDTWTWRHGFKILGNAGVLQKNKTEAQAIFPHPFTFCFSCKQKLDNCQFDDVTNESYPFSNRLNRFAHL